MAVPETMQARQAALLLHGLPRAVRQQVLAKLDVAESARLKPLLDELTELGVSQMLGLQLQHLASPPPTAPASTARELTPHERVERLNAEDVARCFQSCAAVTVAQLLRARTWPWREKVLDLMPEGRRAEVLEHTRRSEFPSLAPAALAFLYELLCLHTAHGAEGHSQPSGSPALRLETSARPAVGRQIRAHLERLIGWMR